MTFIFSGSYFYKKNYIIYKKKKYQLKNNNNIANVQLHKDFPTIFVQAITY